MQILKKSHIFRRRDQLRGHSPRDEDSSSVCAIKDKCRACRYVNLPYTSSLKEKFDRGVAHLLDQSVCTHSVINPPIESPKKLGYRHHFKLVVDEVFGELRIGLYQPGTHYVVDICSCPLHSKALMELLKVMKPALSELNIPIHNREKGVKGLRYIVARAAHQTEELQLTFVSSAKIESDLRTLARELFNEDQLNIKSCHMNLNEDEGNVVLKGPMTLLMGQPQLRERLCNLDLTLSPKAFFQINPLQAEQLYHRVQSLVGPATGGAVAWDLFSGTGQLALLMARLGYRVCAIEENEDAVSDARRNAERNGLESAITAISSRVEESGEAFPSWSLSPDVIVCNPSRSGLAPGALELVSTVMKTAGTRLVYVSCDVQSLARDLKELKQAGIETIQLEAFDMFPQTDNMEWLAVVKSTDP